jgi:type III secretion system YscC/HrcC family outer membrane pore protein
MSFPCTRFVPGLTVAAVFATLCVWSSIFAIEPTGPIKSFSTEDFNLLKSQLPESPGPGLVTDKPKAPAKDIIITKVFPLRYAEARPVLFQQTPTDKGSAVMPGVADSLLNLVFHKPAADKSRTPNVPNISPHPTQNAVVVMDFESRMPFYQQLIDELDKERPLIEISVAIVDVNSSASLAWGAELLYGVNGHTSEGRADLRAGSFARPGLNPLTDALNTSPGLPTENLPVNLLEGPEFTLAGMIANSTARFAARIKTLEGEGKAHVLTRPSVLTLANMEAAFSDDARLFVPVPGVNFANLYEVPVITQIKVIPRVVRRLPDGSHQVQLAVLIEDSSATSTVTIAASDGQAPLPIVASNVVTTQAIVSDKGSLLVAGRYRHLEGADEDRVPILGRIPLVGNLFKQKLITKGRVQRFYLISPRIVRSSQRHQGPNGETIWSYGDGEMESAAAMAANPLLPPLGQPLRASVLREEQRRNRINSDAKSVDRITTGKVTTIQEGQGDIMPATASEPPKRSLLQRIFGRKS